uniref:Uncharacterized protein n=1 Tax=Arundo donax TaxID=35708 RepID=A0A0A9AM31_ARUDO
MHHQPIANSIPDNSICVISLRRCKYNTNREKGHVKRLARYSRRQYDRVHRHGVVPFVLPRRANLACTTAAPWRPAPRSAAACIPPRRGGRAPPG